MGYKRTRSSSRYRRTVRPRRLFTRTKGVTRRAPRKTKFARKIMRVVNQSAEVKEHMEEVADNTTILHNKVHGIYSNALRSKLGTAGETIKTSAGSRVGRRCYVKGIACSLIIESQQYRPNVDYWLYLVRNRNSPDTSITDKSQMFEGVSDQIPTDYIDQSKCQVLFCKKFKPRMPNPGIDNAMETAGTGGASDGNAHNTTGGRSIPNPRLLTKFYVPIKKQIMYRDWEDSSAESEIPIGGQRYQWCMVAYNNNSTVDSGGTWPCGHLWLTTKLKFTDV